MSARGEPIIYEVRIEAEQSIARDVDDWLPQHVAEMLKLPGFTSAQILDDQPLPEPGDGKARRTVQYHLASWDALSTYLREHAARMREAGRQRFGDRMRATRRVLQPMEEAATGARRECSNCHAPLTGQYCALCGQRDRTRMISLWELVADLVGELFDLDSRVWRTLFPLLFRPGRLTREYLLGRRVAFTPPLRLYVLSSLLFFLLATFGGVDATFQIDDDTSQETTTETPDTAAPEAPATPAALAESGAPDGAAAPAPPAEPGAAADEDATDDGDASGSWLTENNGKCTIGDVSTGVAFVDGPLRARLKQACDRIVTDNGKTFVRQLVDNIPKMLVFFLPVIAFVMKPLYFGSRRYYVEHLLFFVHYHSFAFLALSLTLMTSRLRHVFPGWGVANGITIAVVSAYIPYYLFRALRVVYGQGRFFTMIKYIVLFFAYVIGLTVIFALGALVTALTV